MGTPLDATLGEQLRFWRKDATQVVLANKMGYSSPSLISELEAGKRKFSRNTCERLDERLKTGGALTALHTALLEESGETENTPGISVWVRTYESRAEHIDIWAGGYGIPGILQTPEYARAIIATEPGICPDELQRKVSERMARKKAFEASEDHAALTVLAVISRPALDRPLGGPAIMAGQLRHLIELAEDKTNAIYIQVLPDEESGGIGLAGGFIWARLPGGLHAVYEEATGDNGHAYTRKEKITRYAAWADALRRNSLSERESLHELREVYTAWMHKVHSSGERPPTQATRERV